MSDDVPDYARRTIKELHESVNDWKKSFSEQYHKKELLLNVIRKCRNCKKKAKEMFEEFENLKEGAD